MEPKPGCSKDSPAWEEEKLKQELESDESSGSHGILDLSDDVLLYVLKHCSPRDLKALGFTCTRLGRLVCDRSLWGKVDARERSMGREQLAWYLQHTISHHTISLALSGFARESRGCLGTMESSRPILEPLSRGDSPAPQSIADPPPGPSRQPSCFHFMRNENPQLPRFNVSPVWRDNTLEAVADETREPEDSKPDRLKNTAGCGGPRWTLSMDLLAKLQTTCPDLTELRLEYINVNCEATPISVFPPTLVTLSMRGSRCYNAESNKSYLFRIHEFMPLLEEVDMGECGWIEPATLLPLSKLPALRKLYLDRCRRLSECVAYASLAARYGFRALKVLNLLRTPMGDSEVSGLGWLPELEELYLEPAEPHDAVEHHSHYLDDPRVALQDLEPWEKQEPPYFRADAESESTLGSEPALSFESHGVQTGRPGGPSVTHYPIDSVRGRMDMRSLLQDLQACRARQAMRRNEEEAGPSRESGPAKRSKSRASITDMLPSVKPLTRSKTLQEREQAAGPSASTRSKRPHVGEPSTAGALKRTKVAAVEGPATKRPRTQSAEPSPMKTSARGQPKRRSAQRSVDGGGQDERNELLLPSVRSRDCHNSDDLQNGPRPRRRRSSGRNESNEGGNNEGNEGDNARGPMRIDYPRRGEHERQEDDYGEGRVHVIYVNVRRPRHEVYRMLVQDEEPRAAENRVEYERAILNVVEMPRREAVDERPEALRNGPEFAIVPNPMRAGINRDSVMNILRMPFIQNFLYGPSAHVSAASLISDSAITRFGRSDNADVMNYVHIGPNGAIRAGHPPPNHSDRPDKSKLRILVCRGFSGITNRSLNHLVTAAPDLKLLDVTGTKVTEDDALVFKNLRPECEVKYSPKLKW